VSDHLHVPAALLLGEETSPAIGWMSLRKGLDALAKRNIAVNAGDTISVAELKETHSINI
jgi:hypothetical protein